MRYFIILLVINATLVDCQAQTADYIVLRKKNQRTLKTYYSGSFLSAETFDGFRIHGYIQSIQHDSIVILQEESRLFTTTFGTTVDTLRYVYGLYYNQIKRFFYDQGYNLAGKKGFRSVSLPRLMKIGGIGFVFLELVNTAYREESITANNKLVSLSMAAGMAGAGWAWSSITRNRDRVGKKYDVYYIRAQAK